MGVCLLLRACFLFSTCCSIAVLFALRPLPLSVRATAGAAVFNVVDVYNGATGAWSTAQLSVARYVLAAASVGNVALFAGGFNGAFLCREGGVRLHLLLHVFFLFCA